MTWKEKTNGWGKEQFLLDGDGFCVSFVKSSQTTYLDFDGDNDAGPETALVVDGKYFILNGDHRKEYEKLVPQGVEACRAYYKEQAPACKSSWSD